MIVDTHAHLDMKQFDGDRDGVINRARDAGLDLIVTIGTGKPGSPSIRQALDLAEKYDFIYAGLGVHPHDAQLADEAYLHTLEEQMDHPKVIFWGEIGLDYYYDNSPRKRQVEAFRWQLRAALRRRLPVAIHVRDAWFDLVRILREEWVGPTPGGILHSFTGGRDQALEGAELGFHISYSGIATFKSAAAIREAVRVTPADRILVETDSPYLAPVPHRGKRNEPAFVVDVARSVATTLEIGFEELAGRTTRNFRRLAGLDEPANRDDTEAAISAGPADGGV